MEKDHYKKACLMSLISLMIMYAVMFFNVEDASHVYLSLTRLYMSLLMVAPMAPLMFLLMKHMYKNKRLNAAITTINSLIFILSLILLRTQIPIRDVQYMRAMIPHHSSAILTSKNATIRDPELKRLSEQIIKSQEEEINQMKQILERMK